jgi:hypothetical protein
VYQLITSIPVFRPNKNWFFLTSNNNFIVYYAPPRYTTSPASCYAIFLPPTDTWQPISIRYSLIFITLRANLESQSRELNFALECYNQTVKQGKYFINKFSKDSSVGIVSRKGTTHIEPPFLARTRAFTSSLLARRTPGPNLSSAQQSSRDLTQRKKPARGTAYRHTESRLRMCGAVPSLPLTCYGIVVLKQAQK